jgi:predicted patatin/cPLA2 family phospholipase
LPKPDRTEAFKRLKIPDEKTGEYNKIILSLDGGGIRGIMTLQVINFLTWS